MLEKKIEVLIRGIFAK